MRIWRAYIRQEKYGHPVNRVRLEKAEAELGTKYGIVSGSAENLLDSLLARATEPFVYGRGHRKTELQRDIEQLQQLLE